MGFFSLESPTKKATFAKEVTIIQDRTIEIFTVMHVTISDVVIEFGDQAIDIRIPKNNMEFNGHQNLTSTDISGGTDEKTFLSFELEGSTRHRSATSSQKQTKTRQQMCIDVQNQWN